MGAVSKASKIEVVVNVASGSVGRTAPAEMEKILAAHGLTAHVSAPEPHGLTEALREALAAAPDLLIVLAGDGTARAAAELSGPGGPMIAPLPGGTMNVLPHAIYGVRPWQAALELALHNGYELTIGGGVVEGRSFLVGAIFGSPALWAPAREAARYRKLRLAWLRARSALRRTFLGRLRYTLDGGQREKAAALMLMSPLTSKALDDDDPCLEAAAFDVHGAGDLMRIGFHALAGDWRDTPGVEASPARIVRIWGANGIPALLDGETVRLKTLIEVRYTPNLARILAIPKDLKG